MVMTLDHSPPKDSSLYWTLGGVLICHLVLLSGTLFFSHSLPLKQAGERLVVKTVQLTPKTRVSEKVNLENKPTAQQAASSLAPPVSEENKVTAPKVEAKFVESIQEAKKESKKEPKAEVKKATPVEPKKRVKAEVKKAEKSLKVEKKPVPKKETKPASTDLSLKAEKTSPSLPKTEKKKPQESVDSSTLALHMKQKELLAKAQASLSKIGEKREKSLKSVAASTEFTSLPSLLETLNAETLSFSTPPSFTSKEAGYREELANRLKLLLTLPEYGEVKIKLTLWRSGKVSEVAIVKSLSTANRHYIEKIIPTLSFAGFGNNFENKPHYTFLISLSNE